MPQSELAGGAEPNASAASESSLDAACLARLEQYAVVASNLQGEPLAGAWHNRDEGNARLAAIVEHSDDAIISKDLNGIIRSWNRSAERLFGYTAQEAIGKPVLILIPPDRDNEEPVILQRIRSGQTVDHYETVRRRKDGKLLDISLTVSPIRNERGEIIGASKIARDITERKRVEAALRRSETLFRELADSMPQMVWAARPDGYADYFNKRWYEYTGFSEGQFGEEAWRPILHPDDRQRAIETYFGCIRDERPYQIEYRFKDRQSGGYRWFLGRALPIRDETGQVIRWFGTCTDIDDQKRAEEKLEKAVAERTASLSEAIAQMEEFSYTVSHDLRAPLRGMQAYAEALTQDFGASLPTEAAGYLNRIVANATRLDKMILDVLTFSRVARADIRLEPVDLYRLVSHIIEQYPGMQPPQAQIRIDRLSPVLGHEPSLTQAIANLLNNAVKFIPPKVMPEVHVWTQDSASQVRLVVQDNGIGVAPKYQHRLFRMFERVHSGVKYEGTGVGLAIIRKAVERMGGRLGMESDGVHGSRFWIELAAVGELKG
jgi:PAS domain S-box-containing protein